MPTYPHRGSCEPVAIYVASFNTKAWTELCVRSIHAFADAPFHLIIGDSGSTDGSVDALRTLEHDGWLTLTCSPERWHHTDWLDHWVATASVRRALFVDSDVEFRASGWLSRMLDRQAENHAAMVCGEIVPEAPNFIEPVGGKLVRLMERPSPWLLLVDVEQVRSLDTSFAFHAQETDAVPEGLRAYDTGAYVYDAGRRQGQQTECTGRSVQRKYRHYGGASWRGSRVDRRFIWRRTHADRAQARLKRLRDRNPAPSALVVAASATSSQFG